VELEFDDDAGPGVLRKVFAGAKGTVELRLDGRVTTDPAAVDARLTELTGIASEKFFRSTASVRQQELADLDKDEGALRDRLQQSISGGDTGTSAARRKLDEAIRRYRSEGARNPGALKATRDRIALQERTVADGEAALRRLEADRQALSAARTRRAQLDAELADQRRLLAIAERAVQVEAKLAETAARYGRYRRAAELRAMIAAREASHPSSTPLPVLRGGVEHARALERTISELRAGLAAEPDVRADDVPAVPVSTSSLATSGVVLLVAGLLAGVGGAVVGMPIAVVALIALVAIGAGVACLVLARRRAHAVSDLRRERTLRADESSRRLRGRTERVGELERAQRGRDEALAALGVPDLAAAEASLAAETAHVAEIEQLEAECRGLLGEEVVAAGGIEDERDRLAAAADEMRHALSGMGDVGAAPQRDRQRLAAAVARLEADRERAMHAESQAGARVDGNPVDAEEVAASAEALEAARAELAVIERRVRVYQLTLDALEAAENATMKKAARYLEEQMGEDVARITGGRYRRIQVDENELTFRVWAPERDDWVDVRKLSQGTLDQFYLAARLALVRQVTQHRDPPLVFDDPFITFDDTRAREALALLKQMAADHQVIYLTCSSRYDAVADQVVELPGPGSDASVADVTPPVPARVTAPVAGGTRRRTAAVAGQLELLAEEQPLEPSGHAV
jgi:hypothetical protein